jgi:hypothetical protein
MGLKRIIYLFSGAGNWSQDKWFTELHAQCNLKSLWLDSFQISYPIFWNPATSPNAPNALLLYLGSQLNITAFCPFYQPYVGQHMEAMLKMAEHQGRKSLGSWTTI